MKLNKLKSPKSLSRLAQNRMTSIGGRGRWLAAAGALAGSAIFNKTMAGRAERKTPPAGKFVEIDGERLHYVDRGTGPVVVLLHGNGVLLQDFEASGVLGLAAETHRVIAFDRPGFGYSDRASSASWTPEAQAGLIALALEQIGVESAVVVGHSWGTLVSLAMALDHAPLVSGLVLVSGYYYGTARPDVVPFSAPAIPILGPLLANTLAPLTGRLIAPGGVKAAFAPAPVSDKFRSFPLEMTFRPSQVQATASDTALMVSSAVRLSQRYHELDLPIAVFAGEGDLITHIDEHAEKFVSEVASAKLHSINDQGHLLHYAVPDQVVGAIKAISIQLA